MSIDQYGRRMYAQYSMKGCFPQKRKAASPIRLLVEAASGLDSEAMLERTGIVTRERTEVVMFAKQPEAIGMARQVSVHKSAEFFRICSDSMTFE